MSAFMSVIFPREKSGFEISSTLIPALFLTCSKFNFQQNLVLRMTGCGLCKVAHLECFNLELECGISRDKNLVYDEGLKIKVLGSKCGIKYSETIF